MGCCNAPDIFQEEMSELMAGLEFVRVYLDDILCITKSDYSDHLTKLEEVFCQLVVANLKINAEKYFFARSELEYLGFWINSKWYSSTNEKGGSNTNLTAPKTHKELHRFIGIVNYYQDMWPH